MLAWWGIPLLSHLGLHLSQSDLMLNSIKAALQEYWWRNVLLLTEESRPAERKEIPINYIYIHFYLLVLKPYLDFTTWPWSNITNQMGIYFGKLTFG